jgi:hypothetical protein
VFEQACATITVHRPQQRERELGASAFAAA